VWPVGPWSKDKKMKALGVWAREDLLAGLHAANMAIMTRGLKMSVDEVEKFLVDVTKDIKSNKIHAYLPV